MQVIRRPSFGPLGGSKLSKRQTRATRTSELTSRLPEAPPSLIEQLRFATIYVRPDVRNELNSLLLNEELETAKDRLLDYVLVEHETYEELAWFEERRAIHSTIDRKVLWTVMSQWTTCMWLLAFYILA